ncbi:MAG: hypothetical protein DHS20C11_14270 [Lysobacteraceae bacterium]|nr:MAG: hypothetical protein DHS20C11_14270 [Xanthomonadaceae bacterium]
MIRTIALTGLMLLTASISTAAERITSYHSDIVIKESGELLITETIAVVAEGRQIRRGIYRDFPTEYEDRFGHDVNVSFDVLSAKRNGNREPFHTESLSNGVRVYLGSASRMLEHGPHEYEIQFATQYQLGFFEDFDELYFNATGNGWAFGIDQASATVHLPEAASEDDLRLIAYTGSQGSRDQHVNINMVDSQSVRFETTRSLLPYQGLTIAVGFPKGMVHEPTTAEKTQRFLSNNAGILIGLLGTLAVFFYYYLTWKRIGKDPVKGVIYPRYEAPNGYSPGSVRYILRMGYDSGCLSAALVSLAVKGYLRISKPKTGKKYTISRTDKDASELSPPSEAVVLSKLLGSRSELKFTNKNHSIVATALNAHRHALSKEYQKKYFIVNGGWIFFGWFGSIILVILMALFGAFPTLGAFLLMPVLLTINIVFSILMKAPTVPGRKIMDQIEGLKLYLGVAERQDLERQKAPPTTFEEFEKFLPYAVALDCANTWVDRFDAVLRSLQDSGQLQQRGWYTGHGTTMSARGIASSVSSLSSGLSSSISSASSPPGSSSGSGGGGFSGGGGGGGGGGGW